MTLEALKALGVDVANPIKIPAFGLDGAPRIPPTGTLLRTRGERRAWIIDGGARRQVSNLCTDARVVALPDDPQVLDEIPVAPQN